MKSDRRHLLKSASAALLGGGLLSRMNKVAGMQSAASRTPLAQIVNQRATGTSEKMLLGPRRREKKARRDRPQLIACRSNGTSNKSAASRKSSRNAASKRSFCATVGTSSTSPATGTRPPSVRKRSS